MLAASLVLIAILGAPVAEPAEEPAVGTDAVEPTSEPAEPEYDARSAAKQAFDEGLQAVAAGEFDAAVDAFDRAYALGPHPVTLFNLALALENAKRLPEAWELFADMVDVSQSDAERREIRRHMRSIEPRIAIVEVDAAPRSRLCIDGIAMPAGDSSDYRLAVEPGTHAFILDEHRFDVELRAGERRVLLLADSNSYLPGPRRSPALPGLLGLTIGSGALAVGLGVGAAVIRDPLTRRGLAAGAAGSAGIAMIAGITALVLERRAGRSEPDEPRQQDCPGSPTLDKRIDLRVGPTLEQPAEFAELVGPRQELPSALVELAHSPARSFPHPRGLVPPRRSSGSEAAADGERDLAAGEGQAGPQPLAL